MLGRNRLTLEIQSKAGQTDLRVAVKNLRCDVNFERRGSSEVGDYDVAGLREDALQVAITWWRRQKEV